MPIEPVNPIFIMTMPLAIKIGLEPNPYEAKIPYKLTDGAHAKQIDVKPEIGPQAFLSIKVVDQGPQAALPRKKV